MILCLKQKTAYEMRMSDWSSDVCSSDLIDELYPPYRAEAPRGPALPSAPLPAGEGAGSHHRSAERRVGRECVRSSRSRWWPYHLKQTKYPSSVTLSQRSSVVTSRYLLTLDHCPPHNDTRARRGKA